MEDMEEIEQLNYRLNELQDRLFSTRKQALDLISKTLDKYELDYDFSDVTDDDDELFYTIETKAGDPVYFHIVFDVDDRTGFVAAYAQVVEEDEMEELMSTSDDPEIEIKPAVDYWTTTPYLKQTRRSDDSG
jgi:hypothetical protein